MEKSSVQLQRELARTEKNLEFIQNEHSKILAGLHNEIACLTQKCSDLQFSLAMQTEAHNAAEMQRETIKQLQQQNEDLKTNNSRNSAQLTEMESLLSWERLQHSNLVESLRRQLEEKDVKIFKLSKDVELRGEVAKIQAQVKQIYVDTSTTVQNSLQEVARRARSPVSNTGIRIRRRSKPRIKDGSSEASDESFDSCGSLFSSLNDFKEYEKEKSGSSSLPMPAKYISPGKSENITNAEKQLRRTQIFRHHTKLSENQGIYSFSTPPVSLSNVTRRSALPVDYKASVATLPFIAGDNDQTSKYEDVVSNIAVSTMIDSNSPTNKYSLGESSL